MSPLWGSIETPGTEVIGLLTEYRDHTRQEDLHRWEEQQTNIRASLHLYLNRHDCNNYSARYIQNAIGILENTGELFCEIEVVKRCFNVHVFHSAGLTSVIAPFRQHSRVPNIQSGQLDKVTTRCIPTFEFRVQFRHCRWWLHLDKPM